jgi:hypothetical protein
MKTNTVHKDNCTWQFCFIFLSLLLLSTLEVAATRSTAGVICPDSIIQSDEQINPQRLWLVGGGHVLFYTGTLTVLNQMWYKDYPRSSFHFHNDLPDWLQMDKIGHGVTAYHLSRVSYSTFDWTGLNNNRAALWGAISGSLFLTSIEILDGFSEQWGASISDLAANTLGAMVFYAQQIIWKDQKITLKYSYTQSGLSKYRPDLLGHNTGENLIKDYNGQTYWVSVNLAAFAGDNSRIPGWINLALGYGAMGMTGSRTNPQLYQGSPIPAFNRYRQYYLSADIDFARIHTQSHTVNRLLNALNFIKFPAPAIEYNTDKGFSFHLLFF